MYVGAQHLSQVTQNFAVALLGCNERVAPLHVIQLYEIDSSNEYTCATNVIAGTSRARDGTCIYVPVCKPKFYPGNLWVQYSTGWMFLKKVGAEEVGDESVGLHAAFMCRASWIELVIFRLVPALGLLPIGAAGAQETSLA